jgi:membrane associated rhomboid family serine protease
MLPQRQTAYCPRCRQRPLERCSHDEHLVEVCPRCAGLWCEPASWDREKLGPPPATAPDSAHVDHRPADRLFCPRCRSPLTALQIGGDQGCELDQCPRCAGVWFDNGEWEQIEAVRSLQKQEAELDRPTTWGEWAFQFFIGLPVEFNVAPRRFPAVTCGLVGICVAVFLVQLAVGEAVWTQWAMVPADIVAGRKLYTLFTNVFLHGGWFHLIGNMYFLYILGDNVEDVLGRPRYLVFYLVCGLASDGLEIALNPGGQIPTLGASGAIAGVMAAYVVLFREARLTFMLVFWQFKVPAWLWLGFWFGFQLLGAFVDRSGEASGVGFLAHVGGFVAGLAIIWPQEGALLQRHPLLRLLRARKPGAVSAAS